MIIEGFELSSQGNSAVVVANDTRTKKFTVLTNKNLPFTHRYKHLPLWKFNDMTKSRIEKEIREYILVNGTDEQHLIVFGRTFNGGK